MLSRKEEDIIIAIHRIGRPATANEIAKVARYSRTTADKYLSQLEKIGVVSPGKKGKNTVWFFSGEFIEAFKKIDVEELREFMSDV